MVVSRDESASPGAAPTPIDVTGAAAPSLDARAALRNRAFEMLHEEWCETLMTVEQVDFEQVESVLGATLASLGEHSTLVRLAETAGSAGDASDIRPQDEADHRRHRHRCGGPAGGSCGSPHRYRLVGELVAALRVLPDLGAPRLVDQLDGERSSGSSTHRRSYRGRSPTATGHCGRRWHPPYEMRSHRASSPLGATWSCLGTERRCRAGSSRRNAPPPTPGARSNRT